MLDYDSARAKVKKLVEKPADDSTKLPRVSARIRSDHHDRWTGLER